jgi:hypothetical protein
LVLKCTYEPDVWREFQNEYKKFLKESQRLKKPLKRQHIDAIRKSMRKAYQFLEPQQWRALGSCDPKKINQWVANEYRTTEYPKRRPTFEAGIPLSVAFWPTHQTK